MKSLKNAPNSNENTLKGINLPLALETLKNSPENYQKTQSLSKYQKCKTATNEQIKNFVKTLIALFPNQTDLFWQIISKQLLLEQPAYQKLLDIYYYLIHDFPYRTLTANTILGFNENIETFNAEQLGSLMQKFPTTTFASIQLKPNHHVYATLENAQKTNLPFTIIQPLKTENSN